MSSMKSRTVVAALGVVGAWLTLAPLALAQVPDILILEPKAGEPVFGEVEIQADVLASESIEEVLFLVDGREVARFAAPPYRVTVDVGQANVEHVFEFVARTASGTEGRAGRRTPPLRVDEEMDLELQQLYVTLQGSDGRRILGLGADAFEILDNDARQKMVTFEPGDVPFTATILVDASTSMRGDRLRLAVNGALSFVQGMKDLDEAALLLFSDRLLYSTPFSGDSAPMEAALESVRARGGTAINDHLYVALKRLESRQGRRVAILLTDGIDIESALEMEKVLWMARRSQTLIYWIRLIDEGQQGVTRFSSWRDPESHRQELQLLEQAVRESGGRIVPIERLEDAAGVFSGILRELREQYVLGYYPIVNTNDGSWHEVEVRVRGAGSAKVRTREGYVDF